MVDADAETICVEHTAQHSQDSVKIRIEYEAGDFEKVRHTAGQLQGRIVTDSTLGHVPPHRTHQQNPKATFVKSHCQW